jgi:hypothetical protein
MEFRQIKSLELETLLTTLIITKLPTVIKKTNHKFLKEIWLAGYKT